jgi:hypothetical protein
MDNDRDIAEDLGDDYLWLMGGHDPEFPKAINCHLCDVSYFTLQKRIDDYEKALIAHFCQESIENLRMGLANDLYILSQRKALLYHITSSDSDKKACLRHNKARMDSLEILLNGINLAWHKRHNDAGQAFYIFEYIPPIGTIPAE